MLLVLTTVSCRGVSTSFDNLACEQGQCRDGDECRSDTNTCAPMIVRACDGSGLCWSDISAAAPCDTEGAFVPCSISTDCSGGCRTCESGRWSPCGDGCELGTVKTCATCEDDCTSSILNATAQCIDAACTYETCAADFEDRDGLFFNGCECGPVGLELCDGADNDCDGQTDELSRTQVTRECDALYPGTSVDVWRCEAGCEIATCAPGTADTDGLVDNGCEGGCTATNGGVETCDGIDNDCNLQVDDGIGDINADCMTQNTSAIGVSSWRCDAVEACSIDTCSTDFFNFDDEVGNGCETFCIASNSGQEACDNLDNDCDGETDEGTDLDGCVPHYRDEDGDGIGRPGDSQCLCQPSAPYSSISPGDCTDNGTNLGNIDCTTYYRDEDDDGHGIDTDNECACHGVGHYDATSGGDCDDEPTACGDACNPAQQGESCDGYDNDCDGTTDVGCQLFSVLDAAGSNLVNDDVTAMAIRADGGLFVGTSGAGQASYLPVGASEFADVNGLKSHGIVEVIAVGSDFWAGFAEGACDSDLHCGYTEPGVPECGPQKWVPSESTATLYCTDDMSRQDNGAVSLAHDPDTGDIYIGTIDDHALYKADADKIDCDIESTNNEMLRDAVLDADSPRHVWFATYTRLYECTQNHAGTSCSDVCSSRNEAFATGIDDLSTLAFDDAGTPTDTSDDMLWVGSYAYGLSVYLIATDTSLGVLDDSNALPSNRVQAIAVARGKGGPRAYIGTDAGLVVIDIAFTEFTVYDTATPDALPSNDITALAVDVDNDRLWIGTAAGVVRAQPLP